MSYLGHSDVIRADESILTLSCGDKSDAPATNPQHLQISGSLLIAYDAR